MNSLMLAGGVLKTFVSLFTTVSTEKRNARVATLKTILMEVHTQGKKRSVFGWALVFLVTLFTMYDLVTTGGQNFDSALQLFGVALAA